MSSMGSPTRTMSNRRVMIIEVSEEESTRLVANLNNQGCSFDVYNANEFVESAIVRNAVDKRLKEETHAIQQSRQVDDAASDQNETKINIADETAEPEDTDSPRHAGVLGTVKNKELMEMVTEPEPESENVS